MPEAGGNEMNQIMAAMLFGPKTQADLNAVQQQQALANAMLQEGISPISTSNRQIGGMGYRISPFEGLAKMGEIIAGKLGQKSANDALVKALTPQQQAPQDNISGNDRGQQPLGMQGGLNGNLFYDQQGNLTPIGNMGIMSGNRAIAEMRQPNEVRTAQWALGNQAPQIVAQQLQNQANPGMVAFNQGLGTAAAQQAPAGQMPQGAPQPSRQQTSINPVSGGMNPMMSALVNTESGGNPNAVSPAGAQGIAQIMPATAAQPGYGVQPLQGMTNGNPATAPVPEQMRFANDYLNAMQNKVGGGNPQLGAAAYNAGPGRVQQALAQLPKETQNYVQKVAPPSPAGMTNAQYNASLEAWKAGQTENAKVAPQIAAEAGKEQVAQKINAQDVLARTQEVNQNFDKLEQIIQSYPTNALSPYKADMQRIAPAFGETAGKLAGHNAADADVQMDQLVNATLLPQIKAMLQGTGQVRVPEINFLKELHNVSFSNLPSQNIAILNNLRTMVNNEATAALSKAGYNAQQGAPIAPKMEAYPTTNAPSFTEGQTATNPQTGHKMIFTNGQWKSQ